MYLSDYHVHTQFSADCNTPMEDVIKSAAGKGLKEIVLTDHVDYDYPNPEFNFMVNYDAYLVTFNKLKKQYQKNIDVLLGVEAGCQPHVVEEIHNLVTKYPFDFVILSTHTVDRINCSEASFFSGREQHAAYQRYLEDVLENVKNCRNYDVCGHLDFIVRYGPYTEKSLNYKEFSDLIDPILKNIIETGHGIELNTSGYRYGLNQTHPSLDIIKRYRELGGEIITIGSDAHKAEDVSSHFILAHQILQEAGFKKFTVFRQRKPYFVSLGNPYVKLPASA